MSSTTALLALVTIAASASAGQHASDAPIRDAVRHAQFDVTSPPAAANHIRGNWNAVASLAAGSEVRLTLASPPSIARRFVHADDAGIRVFDPENAVRPATARGHLIDLLVHHSMYVPLAMTVGGVRHRSLLVSLSGVFVDGSRVAALDEVFVPIARIAIVEI